MKHQQSGYTRVLLMVVALAGAAVLASKHSHAADDGAHAADHGSHAMPPRRAAESAKALPLLRIVSPVAGAQVGPNIQVEFETDADMASMTMSAKSIGVHLHVGIDDTTLMPMMADLVRVGNNRYRYVFDLPANLGQHVIRVFWADAAHRTIKETVQQVTVTVGDDAAGKKK